MQATVEQINKWTRKWRINESKFVHVNFTNKKIQHISVNINGNQIPYSNTAKYLGITLDAKLSGKHMLKRNERNWT